MSAPLLVELLCEELPPKALGRLGAAFAKGLRDGLAKRGLIAADEQALEFATPRRLAAGFRQVRAASEPKALEVKLMPVSVGLDASGKPTPALLKKLEAAGLAGTDPATFKRRMDGKAEALFVDTMTPAVPLAAALQGALDEAIAALPIPKLMSYQLADGETTVHFVRPAHALVALHGEAVVPVKALGLSSGRETRGHRFQGAKRVTLSRADDYERALAEEGGTIASFARRRAEILRQLEAAAAKHAGSLGPTGGYEALLDEVTALVEMPTIYAGEFEKEFLEVPQECLILTMRQNQKYFPLFDGAGKLTNRFLIVSNMRLAEPVNIVQGNERVVRPRLADARFFFETDRKTKLASRIAQLETTVYHRELGTQKQRVDRLVALAQKIQESLPRGQDGVEWAVRAAYLAKADLVTLMVGEFPELQGIMGRYYAEADGEEPSVCRAIEQHYWPRFAGDALPTGDASIAVALADRLDSLVGMFSIGQVPTGDKDPFGLRRAALGVVRILMETPGLKADLRSLIDSAAGVLGVAADKRSATVGSVYSFVRDRLANLMRERGYSANEVASVLEVERDEAMPGRLDLVPQKLEAVRAFLKLPEAGSLVAANKRISNILRQATQKKEPFEIVKAPFGEPLERDLFTALQSARNAASPLFEKGDYAGYLRSFAVLKAPVDAFFDGVMVMADDPQVRRNRLSLLNALQLEMNRVADIAKLAA